MEKCDDGDLFDGGDLPDGMQVLNGRCVLMAKGESRVVSVCGMPCFASRVGDRPAKAHAMVSLVEAGLERGGSGARYTWAPAHPSASPSYPPSADASR